MSPLRLAIIAGEESGDILGADLVTALRQAGHEVSLIGVGGAHLSGCGLVSMFDPSEISLMGIAPVLKRLPSLLVRIRRTASAIAEARPDMLIIVDSPGFNLRVAQRVRALVPGIPIVKYVSPSVWAYWPERAARMRPHVDHVLCLLPFEPAVLQRLSGPPGTYVGHRLMHDEGLRGAAAAQAARGAFAADAERILMILPGSRRSEVDALIRPFGEMVAILAGRGLAFRIVIPTLPRLAGTIEQATAAWRIRPHITQSTDEKWAAFGSADVALAASGTVSLELALAGVPTVSCYVTDPLVRILESQITTWSACLPNIIADEAIVPEFYDRSIRPAMVARYVEGLMINPDMRRVQISGFSRVAAKMTTARPAGEIAAGVVLDILGRRAA